jgi:hypothetical protein
MVRSLISRPARLKLREGLALRVDITEGVDFLCHPISCVEMHNLFSWKLIGALQRCASPPLQGYSVLHIVGPCSVKGVPALAGGHGKTRGVGAYQRI